MGRAVVDGLARVGGVAGEHCEKTAGFAQCERQNVRVKLVPDMFQISISQVELEMINGIPMLGVREPSIRGWKRAVKRSVDVLVVIVALVLLAPLMALIALAIRLESRGPSIFRQVRVGRDGKDFVLYKFRTMVLNAERNGAEWATEKDPRVTPFGSFLRKTRLDELPQLWNVLKGDMSFVGPRPERPELVKVIEKEVPYFTFRNWARPGITGLAQIRYRYGASVEDARKKLQYDLYYIKNWSILLDLQIILRTIAVLMKGAR